MPITNGGRIVQIEVTGSGGALTGEYIVQGILFHNTGVAARILGPTDSTGTVVQYRVSVPPGESIYHEFPCGMHFPNGIGFAGGNDADNDVVFFLR